MNRHNTLNENSSLTNIASQTMDVGTYKEVVEYLKNTKESEWHTKETVSECGKKFCIVNHLIRSELFFNLEWHYMMTGICEKFLFDINDGLHPDYQQKTAKQRCIAFYTDLSERTEETQDKAHKFIKKRKKEQRKELRDRAKKNGTITLEELKASVGISS